METAHLANTVELTQKGRGFNAFDSHIPIYI